ncbi:Endonuclease/exonuclease/phosphatase, partial [Panaeolus papilionaceus]
RTKAHINVFTFNMNGGGTPSMDPKWDHINQMMRDFKLGAGAIQETHLSEERVMDLETRYPRIKIFNSQNPERLNSKGVVICLNKLLTRADDATKIDLIPGRAILVKLPWSRLGTTLNIIGIYAPNTPDEQITFWTELYDKIIELGRPNAPDIMLGDFNIVENVIDRLPQNRHDNQTAVEKLQTLRERYDLIDQWRNENPHTKEFTYKQLRENNASHSRIDRIYLNRNLTDKCFEWNTHHTGIPSDHKMVRVKIEIPNMPYIGTGRWAMPNYILKDREAIKEFKKLGMVALNRIKNQNNEHTTARDYNENPNKMSIQEIHEEFKRNVRTKARDMARVKAPKIRKAIQDKQIELKQILNERRDQMPNTNERPDVVGNRIQQASILEEELKELYRLMHNNTRENINAKFSREAETICKSWIAAN